MDIGAVYQGLTLLHYCGSGAFGEVYQCRDLSGKILAVKIIPKHKFGNAWERELRGVSNYRVITENAPALLKIYHVGEDEESFFYTMDAADSINGFGEYKPDTLAARLQTGAIPPNELYRILKGIFIGIKTIHEAGFAHRDIKPDNIVFVNGQPKLGDIGLVSSLSATLTQMAGTLEFLPPEQRTGENPNEDRSSRQKSDLYAFGKIIYCAATGLNPQQFPTVPEALKLSLPVKYFLRLAFRLCEREPLKRLANIREVEHELSRIEHKLLYGETIFEQLGYLLRAGVRNILCPFLLGWHWCRRHWIICLSTILLAGCEVWYFWPEPPFDITKQKTKIYSHPDIKLSMSIPMQWETLSAETLKTLFKKSRNELDSQALKQLEFLEELFDMGGEMIICGIDGTFTNNITIQPAPLPGEELFAAVDDEIRTRALYAIQKEFGFNPTIYSVKRMTLAGRPCIFIDLSQNPGIRAHNYIVSLGNQCVSICLTATTNTFSKYQEQFEAVLKTLKIEE